MEKRELEQTVLEALGRFASLEFPTLIRLCLMDRACYSTAHEEKLRLTLQDLVKRGQVETPRPGCFRLPIKTSVTTAVYTAAQQPAGRSGFFRRLRSG